MRKLAPKEVILFSMCKFTLEKRLTNAANVKNLLATDPNSFHIRALIVEEHFMTAVNVGNPLAEGNTSFPIGESTLEKSLMSARSVINPSD